MVGTKEYTLTNPALDTMAESRARPWNWFAQINKAPEAGRPGNASQGQDHAGLKQLHFPCKPGTTGGQLL